MSGQSPLPVRSSTNVDLEPAVIEFTDADAVFEVLASKTAREILEAVYDSPAPPSEIVDRVGTSLQNVGYHLDRLEEAGLVMVIDTWYSSKGIKMDVYAARNAPLVIQVGDAQSAWTTC